MNFRQHFRTVSRAIGRGVFPHQFSWLLELPIRRLLLSPAMLAARLQLRADFAVLELGAGSGFYSIAVARSLTEGRLSLVDIQPAMLHQSRTKAIAAGLTNLEFVVSDAASLPFASAAFDLVYLVAVLGEIADANGILSEIRRVLRPAGLLSISEHLPDPDFTTCATTRLLLESHGFELAVHRGTWWAYTATFRPHSRPSQRT